jgi:hypothetical protein
MLITLGDLIRSREGSSLVFTSVSKRAAATCPSGCSYIGSAMILCLLGLLSYMEEISVYVLMQL